MKINFTKMNGIGNDFIIIDDRNEEIYKRIPYDILVKKLCNRNFSIGADGLILVLNSRTCDFKMRIFNNDGREAEMCGNGIRCFARFIYDNNITLKKTNEIETLAGKITPTINFDKNNNFESVSVDMGKPILTSCANETLDVDGKTIKTNCVSMGNPHCVIFVEDLKKIDFENLGKKIEVHKKFPSKTNVEFAQIISKKEITARIWERGVGETLACGTGACGIFVAARNLNLIDEKIKVNLKGGILQIFANKENIFKTGNASYSFIGHIESFE